MFTDDVLPADLVHHELVHQHLSGRDTAPIRARFEQAIARGDDNTEELRTLLGEAESLGIPRFESWPNIEAALPTAKRPGGHPITMDRIHAAWLGRVIGNMVGKPIEWGPHWTRDRIKAYLVEQSAYPLLDYVPVNADEATELQFRENWTETTLGRVAGSSRDDDVDYTVLALCLVETHGRAFTTADVAELWLQRLPFHQVYTAERAAYRNLVNGVAPTEAALSENPYREWIGALIRADFYGYINPGDPREAARLAYEDARLSHVGNGLYGAMWAAALIAESFVADSARSALVESLNHIPSTSALFAEVSAVLADSDGGSSWSRAIEGVETRHSGLNWVHTLNNAGAITAGLLWGDGDFARTVGLTVQAGLDTDSNGATAGSAAAALLGLNGIPDRLSQPIGDRLRSAVFGFDDVRISDLAERTHGLIHAMPAPGGSDTGLSS